MDVKQSKQNEPLEIGGWLIVLGLGIFVSILFCIYDFFSLNVLLFQDEISIVKNIFSVKFLFFFQYLSAFFICAGLIALFYLFSKRNVMFTDFFIFMCFIIFIYDLGCIFLMHELLPANTHKVTLVSEQWRSFFADLARAIIWISYLLMSKRVKKTFVIGKSAQSKVENISNPFLSDEFNKDIKDFHISPEVIKILPSFMITLKVLFVKYANKFKMMNLDTKLYFIVGALLLLALFKMPFGYYVFLRIAVCASAVYIAIQKIQKVGPQSSLGILFIAVAILFNPLIPVPFEKGIWDFIDLAVAVLYFCMAFYELRLTRKK